MNEDILKHKKEFNMDREEIFNDPELRKDSFRFCVNYSLMIEERLRLLIGSKKIDFVIASAGSFSRRELSPFSDIDLMFILPVIDGREEIIKEIITDLWDAGIEASHTVRDFNDIEKFINDDLHTFTQFFETRFLLGSEKVYSEWNARILAAVTEENIKDLIAQYKEDISGRHEKFGDSAKILEPNVKSSAGGLRDFQAVEWMFSLRYRTLLTEQSETTQAESFIKRLLSENVISQKESARVLESYRFILATRNCLHLIANHKTDRLEFENQKKVARELNFNGSNYEKDFMKRYFQSANAILRFSKTMIRRFDEEISNPISDYLAVELDQDFVLKGDKIYSPTKKELNVSEIIRAFYYRGLNSARFEESLRSSVIDKIESLKETNARVPRSSVFFREILKLPKNVGDSLSNMNELGVLSALLPEFEEMVGYFQAGVYHCYTADEHTIVAIKNVEKLRTENSLLGKIFNGLKNKELLYLALLLHDIAKPISLSGHEIIGAEVASTIMQRLGYDDEEIKLVSFLVRHHLTMEQVAFRRNLNDPDTLNNFVSIFDSPAHLDMLYVLTYADLSAVNAVVWTQWKNDLLSELYRKTKTMLDTRVSGEELLYTSSYAVKNKEFAADEQVQNHLESINDVGYAHHFTDEEISEHISEIERGLKVSVFFKEEGGFTGITVLTRDFKSLLSRLCGALAINDLNIHDAKIFTRKDGIVIDSFNVTDFKTNKEVSKDKYEKIKKDIRAVIFGSLELSVEFTRIKSKWKRLERKFFRRTGKISVTFEEQEKFTIMDVASPDRIGLLYAITNEMNELGLSIYFAKIATKADDVVDSFYVLDRNNKKISRNSYELIRTQITDAIKDLL